MKSRKCKAMGGEMDSPTKGNKEYEEDMKTKPARYTGGKPEDEAEERKHGGRMKKKKHVGKVHGEKAMHHMGRKPRKSGGRTGSDTHPFSSARAGTEPRGHKDTDID